MPFAVAVQPVCELPIRWSQSTSVSPARAHVAGPRLHSPVGADVNLLAVVRTEGAAGRFERVLAVNTADGRRAVAVAGNAAAPAVVRDAAVGHRGLVERPVAVACEGCDRPVGRLVVEVVAAVVVVAVEVVVIAVVVARRVDVLAVGRDGDLPRRTEMQAPTWHPVRVGSARHPSELPFCCRVPSPARVKMSSEPSPVPRSVRA